jgi:tRNA pseudouridine13 synthase
MYKIKMCPEDFIVKEISKQTIKESGIFSICVLKKKNYTTIRAIDQLARSFGKRIYAFGFAGTKDKNAITLQHISIKNIQKEMVERLRLKDIELEFVGYSDKPISLGQLEGNEFIITVRELTKKQVMEIERLPKKIYMPNFFGEQRFSSNNAEIGKSLLKKNYGHACKLILESSDYSEKMEEFLKDKPKEFVGALKKIPRKLFVLYIHAYQSHLWNITLKKYLSEKYNNTEVPIIGFDTEPEGRIGEIIECLMKEEFITFRDFINRQIPEITCSNVFRKAFVEIIDFKVLEKGDDFVKINFKLPKGSYATVAVDFIFNN